jgi:lactoylglutathione lyase
MSIDRFLSVIYFYFERKMLHMKMAHTCVRVKDLDASLEFYQKAFNFEESRRRDFPEHKFTLVYLTLPGDAYELELTYNYDHEAYDLGDGYGHIAISTDEIEKLHEEQKNAGFNVTDMKGLPGTPPSYYFITDPDGYKIEVIRAR